ncbi:unnamed protein product, partial [Urochloa humidicola]
SRFPLCWKKKKNLHPCPLFSLPSAHPTSPPFDRHARRPGDGVGDGRDDQRRVEASGGRRRGGGQGEWTRGTLGRPWRGLRTGGEAQAARTHCGSAASTRRWCTQPQRRRLQLITGARSRGYGRRRQPRVQQRRQPATEGPPQLGRAKLRAVSGRLVAARDGRGNRRQIRCQRYLICSSEDRFLPPVGTQQLSAPMAAGAQGPPSTAVDRACSSLPSPSASPPRAVGVRPQVSLTFPPSSSASRPALICPKLNFGSKRMNMSLRCLWVLRAL